jgi:3D (Asp-Asp-Asp) domain-containing protein
MPRRALLSALLACLLLPAAAPAASGPLRRPTTLTRTAITEYFPVPESWFSGRLVTAPGIPGRHRADWLYSARGVSMEGDGVSVDGLRVHVESTARTRWVNRKGRTTKPGLRGWTRGAPFWRVGPLTFGTGPSRPLRYWASAAVDPRLIPLGSRVHIPAYAGVGGSNGWFLAEDTGGAIQGRHLDVYRPAPARGQSAGSLAATTVRVFPPGTGGQLPAVASSQR